MTSTSSSPARATELPTQQQQQPARSASPQPTATTTTLAGPAGTSEDQTKEIAPFLRSLRRMLDRESDAILCWTPDGRAFEIHDMEVMTSYILPKYFKHAKYTSFQRQLNYFNFRKWTKSRAVVCTFSNAFFVRDQPDLTWRITRKRGLSDAKSAASDSGASSSPRTSPKSPKPRAPSAVSGPATTATAAATSSKPVALKRESSGSKRKAPSAPSTSARKVTKVSASASSIKTEPLARTTELGVESLEWVDTLYPSLETLEAECSTSTAPLSPSPLSSPTVGPSAGSESSISGLGFVAPAPIFVGYSYGASSGLGSTDSSAYSNYGSSYSEQASAYAWPQYSPSVEDADRFRSAASAYFTPTVVQTSCVAL